MSQPQGGFHRSNAEVPRWRGRGCAKTRGIARRLLGSDYKANSRSWKVEEMKQQQRMKRDIQKHVQPQLKTPSKRARSFCTADGTCLKHQNFLFQARGNKTTEVYQNRTRDAKRHDSQDGHFAWRPNASTTTTPPESEKPTAPTRTNRTQSPSTPSSSASFISRSTAVNT